MIKSHLLHQRETCGCPSSSLYMSEASPHPVSYQKCPNQSATNAIEIQNEDTAKSTNLIDILPLITVWLQVPVSAGAFHDNFVNDPNLPDIERHRSRLLTLHDCSPLPRFASADLCAKFSDFTTRGILDFLWHACGGTLHVWNELIRRSEIAFAVGSPSSLELLIDASSSASSASEPLSRASQTSEIALAVDSG